MLSAYEFWYKGSYSDYLFTTNFSLNSEENDEYSKIASDVVTLCEEDLTEDLEGGIGVMFPRHGLR